MTLPQGIVVLGRVARWLAASPDEADRCWGERLERWLAGGAGDLDALFGLQGEPGGPGWRTIAAIQRRDAALIEAARRFDLAPPALAERLARYAATSWLRERDLSACPARHAGQIEALLWAALRARPHVLSVRQVREVLRRSARDQTAVDLVHDRIEGN